LHISANIQNLLHNFLAPCPHKAHIIHTKFLFKIRLLKLTDKKQFKKKLTDDRQTDRDDSSSSKHISSVFGHSKATQQIHKIWNLYSKYCNIFLPWNTFLL